MIKFVEIPDEPSSLTLSTDDSCIFVKAQEPLMPNGVIIHYEVSVVKLADALKDTCTYRTIILHYTDITLLNKTRNKTMFEVNALRFRMSSKKIRNCRC